VNKKIKIKVCHLTSVHPPYDIRIFYKICVSLANAGFNVSLIAPDAPDEIKLGVKFTSIKLPDPRFKRMLVVTFRMFRLALKQKARVYHFHDPELMLCGVLLRMAGKIVIFDIHENIRLSLVSKDWLPQKLGLILGWVYFIFERICILFFTQLILAEESYLKYYPKKKSVVILNYPISDDNIQVIENKKFEEPLRFVYSGVVHALRGVWEMLQIIQKLNKEHQVTLDLVGEVRPIELQKNIYDYISSNNLGDVVKVYGKVDFSEVKTFLDKADIGFSLLKPIPNYRESLPTKIFEYMQHGLAVITNDFPLYIRYVEDTGAGICLNIENYDALYEKLSELVKSKTRLAAISTKGIELTSKEFNWKSQESKLLNVYNSIL